MPKFKKNIKKGNKNDLDNNNTKIDEIQALIVKIENKNLSEYIWKNVYLTENFKIFCLNEKK